MDKKSRGDLIELDIGGVTSDGRGVGRADGLAVFVAGALPGEHVAARICARKKSFAEASLVQVLKSTPGRAVPSCPNYAKCGGCSLQHADYQTELKLKQQIVQQSLRRLGAQEVDVPLPLAAERPLGYRNRAVFHYKDGQLGFYDESSRQMTPLESCDLLMPALNELLLQAQKTLFAHKEELPGLRAVALRCDSTGRRKLATFICDQSLPVLESISEELVTKADGLVSIWECFGPQVYGAYGNKWQLLRGRDKLRDNVGPVQLDLSPASFLQVNPRQTIALYEMVRSFAALTGKEKVLDLYSGVGSIALYLAPHAGQVKGVESYAPAVNDAQANAVLNSADNCSFYCGRAEDVLPCWAASGLDFDVAILDPPRAGCDRRLLDAVAAIAPPRLVYVSCSPATLARDLKILTAYGYTVDILQPVDMFSRTCHCECAVSMSRK